MKWYTRYHPPCVCYLFISNKLLYYNYSCIFWIRLNSQNTEPLYNFWQVFALFLVVFLAHPYSLTLNGTSLGLQEKGKNDLLKINQWQNCLRDTVRNRLYTVNPFVLFWFLIMNDEKWWQRWRIWEHGKREETKVKGRQLGFGDLVVDDIRVV